MIYEKNKKINKGVWNQKDIVKFNVEISDTISLHNFYINIRNSGNYTYSNIFLFINTIFPDGKKVRDTVECMLANPDGQWLGKGLSDIKYNRILLKKGIKFLQKGNYSFEFEQGMRKENLLGIVDIGIRIESE
jgi:gliding motility-associated lipoprotein GldH